MKFRARYCALLAGLLLAFAPNAKGNADQIEVIAAPGSRLLISNTKQTFPVRVSLTGFKAPDSSDRAPVNIAIVLDRSGSMAGDKMIRAREAAIGALNYLRSNDIVSVVAYDDVVETIVPATKVSDRDQIIQAIQRIDSRGGTGLFAGVSRGASEVQKFLNKNHVNRVILISDGLANQGPSSPAELGSLGESLGREGISVTTIGLGLDYNEDLMTQLAGRSDGNHAFVENSSDLARIFQREFGDILSVVAKDIDIEINCAEGFRPVRVIGRNAEIHGQRVFVPLNQIYASQEKYLILEVETFGASPGTTRNVASVEVKYANLKTSQRDKLSRQVSVAYSDSQTAVDGSVDRSTIEGYYTQIGAETKAKAIALRDANRKGEAQSLLKSSAGLLREKATRYQLPSLGAAGGKAQEEAEGMDSLDWKKQRKVLSEDNYVEQNQMKR